MKITVFGCGYVGLVSGACFAEIGNKVLCVDIDQSKIDNLNKGVIPFYEPGLDKIINHGTSDNNLQFSTVVLDEFKDSDVYFIAVGTPPKEDGSANIDYVLTAAKTISGMAKKEAIIAVKSTVPVGTCDKIEELINNHILYVVSNPEFLKEGDAVNDFLHPDRVVIGVKDLTSEKIMRELYSPLLLPQNKTIVVDRRSAELGKCVANSMLATRVSFINEVARLCDAVHTDIDSVKQIIASDSRIGPYFLNPGPGFGGYCLPKDALGLISVAEENDVLLNVIKGTIDSNNNQIDYIYTKLNSMLNISMRQARFTIWGLAFKSGTDDVRDSPTARLLSDIFNSRIFVPFTGNKIDYIKTYDPEASDNFKRDFNFDITYCKDKYEALNDSECLIIMTDWPGFKNIDINELKTRMKTLNILDTRNILSDLKLKSHGFNYVGVGKGLK
jgi:UDPglucose 6-dehydrogenase